MRRIERLLVVDSISEGGQDRPKANGTTRTDGPKGTLSPTTQGLLLLYLTHLRGFAEKYLKESTRFREGFLEDVEDLEDTRLGREEKRIVVRRMWESWGTELGWRRMGKL
jgi:ATP synthase regulation protein NCA2